MERIPCLCPTRSAVAPAAGVPARSGRSHRDRVRAARRRVAIMAIGALQAMISGAGGLYAALEKVSAAIQVALAR